jgi:X-X-X-Leu-X-X-Gly heptad repeat protein
MGERADAKRSIESSTRHMSEIAEELSRRASPRYIGEQAREKALNKTHEWKEEMTSSPMALGLIGGALGAAIGGALARNRRGSLASSESRRFAALGYDDRRFDHGYGGYPASRERPLFRDDADGAGGMREKIADGAQELKDRAGELVSGVRERIPSAAELGRAADDNPLLIALGGIALGAIAALLLPVTRKERELLDPVKQKAGEAIGAMGSKVSESVQQAQEKIAGQQENTAGQQGRQQSEGYPPRIDSPLLTH